IEEKERQYEKHKHLVEQQRNASLRLPTRICPECNKGFSKRKQFVKHLKTHRPLLECRYCSFKSRSKKLHKNHEARHQKDDPQFACSICPMKFVESSQLRGHMSRQHGIFYCPRCCHQAASFEERNEHMQAEHGVQIKRKLGLYTFTECDDDHNTEQQNACNMCFKKCRSRALLRIHVAQHYNVDPNQLSDGLEPLEKSDPVVSEAFSDESSDGLGGCKVAYTPSRPKKRINESTEDEHPSSKVARFNCAQDNAYSRYVNDPE
ncbi:Zinc finger double-stranded RNA binding, partial [Trinorchestia longiramus]